VAILAVFPGWLTLWLAVLGDMGASVLVTLNGMRMLALKPAGHSHHGEKGAGCSMLEENHSGRK